MTGPSEKYTYISHSRLFTSIILEETNNRAPLLLLLLFGQLLLYYRDKENGSTMPAAKRSRNSGARVSTKRGKSLKANLNNTATNGKHFASDDENVEQEMRVAKRTKTEQTSTNPERWTPYFKSKNLYALEDGEAMQLAAARDEQAGDFKGVEMTAMQVRL